MRLMGEPSAACDLCAEMGGATDETEFGRTYEGDPGDRVILASENLRLLADLSPLTTGHVLLLPTQHYLNFASVMAGHATEVMDLLQTIWPTYVSEYGQLAVLEHGSSSAMLGSACI